LGTQAKEKTYFMALRHGCARAFGRAERSLFLVRPGTYSSPRVARLGNVAGLLSFVPRCGTGLRFGQKLRAQRLGLLQMLVKEFSSIADFSEIVTEKKS
jgi:hypothetical protein